MARKPRKTRKIVFFIFWLPEAKFHRMTVCNYRNQHDRFICDILRICNVPTCTTWFITLYHLVFHASETGKIELMGRNVWNLRSLIFRLIWFFGDTLINVTWIPEQINMFEQECDSSSGRKVDFYECVKNCSTAMHLVWRRVPSCCIKYCVSKASLSWLWKHKINFTFNNIDQLEPRDLSISLWKNCQNIVKSESDVRMCLSNESVF